MPGTFDRLVKHAEQCLDNHDLIQQARSEVVASQYGTAVCQATLATALSNKRCQGWWPLECNILDSDAECGSA